MSARDDKQDRGLPFLWLVHLGFKTVFFYSTHYSKALYNAFHATIYTQTNGSWGRAVIQGDLVQAGVQILAQGHKAKRQCKGNTSYNFLVVQLDNKLEWSTNTEAVYKMGISRLYLLRRLRPFSVCRRMLHTFYQSVIATTICFAVVCRGAGIKVKEHWQTRWPHQNGGVWCWF